MAGIFDAFLRRKQTAREEDATDGVVGVRIG
eukprot:CAMPEP_0118877108 /NCGR_PEP_ID=MMETSP1163-20130328/17532_1 /TAXON_ID=124430 /ORGANISM="Phaeomonas parva, Strain CCMP2877" /LENGTH=30 /DNA_ID= /DNA_START= /DNA_END= /DNA_ORIENTATION=